jgi:hypothetical protein
MDSTFRGIAKFDFELKNYSILAITADTTDSSFDSVRIYRSIGTISFVDSITHSNEKAFIVEILTTSIVGSVYWNSDSTYIDHNNYNHFLDNSENKNIVTDTIQISRSCQKGYGFEIKKKQP